MTKTEVPYPDFGKDLKSLRLSVGMTVSELRDKSGCNEKNIRELEKGKQRPNPQTLLKLCTALDVPRERLARHFAVVPLADSLSEAELDGLADRIAERVSPKLVRALRDELRRQR